MVEARDRGSVLMLVPAAVLVLVILGSIAVDSAVGFLGQRELENFAASASASAASAGLDPGAFYTDHRIVVDPGKADAIVQGMRGQIGSGVHDVQLIVTVDGNQVTVTATGQVDDLFAPVIPGVHHTWNVRATARATARQVVDQ